MKTIKKEHGQANAVYSDNSVGTIIVSSHCYGNDKKENPFVSLDDKNNSAQSIIIGDRNQWDQLKAFVEQALEEIESY